MTRILNSATARTMLERSAELRSYTVCMAVTETVDNHGTQCEYCAEVDALVAANVYVVDYENQVHVADCCLGCIVYVIDGHIDTNPDRPVTIEIAQGAR